ncbi:unnamed protein product [Toxocara canis]|uniref:HintN domain-containing protein n=1 Tax=Toxocara canis TaxID=6265 RepID=A0A183V9L6_TOXCA|nr:unnamed protein product [Toxocara canis]
MHDKARRDRSSWSALFTPDDGTTIWLFLFKFLFIPNRGTEASREHKTHAALPNGKPILGCARPTCFGWSADGKPFSQNAQFYSVNKTADGFVRKSLDSPRERIAEDVKESFQPQIAECELTFESDSCPNDQQWVGGIAPMKKVSKSAMMLQCCSYNVLKHSTDRGVATVHPGEIVIGGEVFSNGRQYAFDYIADIRKMEGDDDKPVYDVTVRRFPCLPIPDEQSVLGKHLRILTLSYCGDISLNAPIETFAAAIPQPGASQQTFQQVVAQPVQQFQPQLVQDYAVQMYRFVPVQQAAASAPPPKRQGGAGEQWCFSNDMKVQTAHNGIKRMDELKVDDWAEYVPVKSWIHRLPEQKAEFLKINLADGNLIKLTRRHFVYKAKCVGREKFITLRQIKKQAVWAEKVHPGDCLFSLHPVSPSSLHSKFLKDASDWNHTVAYLF